MSPPTDVAGTGWWVFDGVGTVGEVLGALATLLTLFGTIWVARREVQLARKREDEARQRQEASELAQEQRRERERAEEDERRRREDAHRFAWWTDRLSFSHDFPARHGATPIAGQATALVYGYETGHDAWVLVRLRNNGDTVLRDAVLQPRFPAVDEGPLRIGVIPPGETTIAVPITTQGGGPPHEAGLRDALLSNVGVSRIDFTDASGATWTLDSAGQLLPRTAQAE